MEAHIPGYTLPYTPPECLLPTPNYRAYSHKIDVYSFGVLLMKLVFSMYPIDIRKDSQDNLLKLLQLKTYMNSVIINPERLGSFLQRDIAEILCMMALKCLDPNPL
jgi:serine/threonine protein kinase